jgi:hypothetical protein
MLAVMIEKVVKLADANKFLGYLCENSGKPISDVVFAQFSS